MNNIYFQLPSWYILLCVLLGLIVSFILYFRENRFKEYNKRLLLLLGFIRFFVVSILAIFLLSPLLKIFLDEVKDPQIIFLEDKSESIRAVPAKVDNESIESNVNQLVEDLSKDYSVSRYQFGDGVVSVADSTIESFQVSNISEALQFAYDLYNDQNLGAIILLTDGIYNEGKNPLYQDLKFKAPVFTVGLGDTTAKRDLLIRNVYFNKIAYLGDKFSVQVDIQGINASNSRSQITFFVEEDNKFRNLHSESFNIIRSDYFETKTFVLEAEQSGIIRYRIVLDEIQDETTSGNNVQDIYVEVLDAKQKIRLIANAPHPDISSLKQVLTRNKNYELEIRYAKDADAAEGEFDFVIFHNLPSPKFGIQSIMANINQKNLPRLFIVGSQTNLNEFNRLQNTLQILGDNRSQNEIQAVPNPNFNLFILEDNHTLQLSQFIPLIAPFGEYILGPKTIVLFNQRIGKIDTDFPLICFSEELGNKTTVITAEGLWKWRLYDQLLHDNDQIFSDLINKIATYTTVKEDKRKFRVSCNKNLYKENEHVYFNAQLYNNSYQLINDPDVFIAIRNQAGKVFDYAFSKRNSAYILDAGLFPEGMYSYEASVNYNGQKLSQTGKFTVQSIQLELFNLTADHQLLYALSEKYGGEFITPQNLPDLKEKLIESEQLKPMVYSTATTKSVIHYKWVFALILLLLSTEWMIRRYLGSY